MMNTKDSRFGYHIGTLPRSSDGRTLREDTFASCPGCGVSLDGGEIPENIRQHYAPPFHWNRGISVIHNDYHDHWKCPDCGYAWR